MTRPTENSIDMDDPGFVYVYAFPLVFNLEQVQRYVSEGVGANPPAAYNTFSHARTLAGPQDTFVSINNDTVYSMAQLDLSVGPVKLTVPDTAGRYYVLQFVDAWTDNFAYVGTRATGTGAGEFLLVPPGWAGDDLGLRVVRFPTRIASIVGRWAVAGDDDLPAVHALQDATILSPLTEQAPAGIPAVGSGQTEAVEFFEKFRVWSQEFPPALRDVRLQQGFSALGLTGADSVARGDAELDAALGTAWTTGRAHVEEIARTAPGIRRVDGWLLSIHGFDYNVDWFELGTIDSPDWQISDDTLRIVSRAAAARAGLWGNHGYEATYGLTYIDSDGAPLDGAHAYRITFDPVPPVDAFWSLTMYSVPDFYLVDNPIGRFSIGDRTPGLVADGAGAVTITISSDEPADPDARANWLPAPKGPFRPVLRMYSPRKTILDGAYDPPPIVRVD
ncbi:DUF1254 domain-containing protein [Prescottella agglutinans]|uniref:DUF1254 domain-containing protein n=1 Tax=Prescottella agglutinans TaxID=1644129 RepID=A0A3S3AKW8_9NOCA|nr:DUF1254 domain-containing protein [Prescottella agglutinans]RVW07132.1 DUF1254 domain-containing protein [Prescottella agglutinans]